MSERISAEQIRLVETCGACPEQYDAYRGDERVGYLRARCGHFAVTCPWVNGEVVYEAEFGDDEWSGRFDDDERAEHLAKSRAAIAQWLNAARDEGSSR